MNSPFLTTFFQENPFCIVTKRNSYQSRSPQCMSFPILFVTFVVFLLHFLLFSFFSQTVVVKENGDKEKKKRNLKSFFLSLCCRRKSMQTCVDIGFHVFSWLLLHIKKIVFFEKQAVEGENITSIHVFRQSSLPSTNLFNISSFFLCNFQKIT